MRDLRNSRVRSNPALYKEINRLGILMIFGHIRAVGRSNGYSEKLLLLVRLLPRFKNERERNDKKSG